MYMNFMSLIDFSAHTHTHAQVEVKLPDELV